MIRADETFEMGGGRGGGRDGGGGAVLSHLFLSRQSLLVAACHLCHHISILPAGKPLDKAKPSSMFDCYETAVSVASAFYLDIINYSPSSL